MKVEYLIIQKEDKDYCNSAESFKSILSIEKSIQIKKDNLIFTPEEGGKSHEFYLNVKSDIIKGKDERYFEVLIKGNDKITNEVFANISRKIREIVSKRLDKTTKINTLWNDIGRDYAIEAYPLINEVENLMRKLITKFLLINIGMDWFKTATHKDIQNKIKEKIKGNIKNNELYHTNFIELSENVLFQKYRSLNLSNLDNIILKHQDENKGEIKIQDVEDILPKSNWERYFYKILDIKESDLKKKWEKLYEYRNYVAHNGFINKSEFDEIKKLCKNLKELLNNTISKADKLEITEPQKQKIIDNFISSRVDASSETKAIEIERNPKHIEMSLRRLVDSMAPKRVLVVRDNDLSKAIEIAQEMGIECTIQNLSGTVIFHVNP